MDKCSNCKKLEEIYFIVVMDFPGEGFCSSICLNQFKERKVGVKRNE